MTIEACAKLHAGQIRGIELITPAGLLPERTGDAVLFATSLPLFLGALFADWAYSSTYVIQWTNFASWLNAGALVIVGLAIPWSLISFLRGGARRDRHPLIYLGLVAGVFVVGFINALVHAKDAWAAMPTALFLSVTVFLLALVAAWIGLNTRRRELAR